MSTVSSTDKKTGSSSKSEQTSDNKTEQPPQYSETTTTTPPATETPKALTLAQIIVGKWRGSVDMAPLLLEEGYVVEGTQMVFCDIEFTSGGVLYEKIDKESMKTVFTNMMTKVMNDYLIENNLTKDQFEVEEGKSYDEFLNELVQNMIDLVPQTIINTYKFEGNDLYVHEQYADDFEKMEYSFNGENQLTIDEEGQSITYTRIS